MSASRSSLPARLHNLSRILTARLACHLLPLVLVLAFAPLALAQRRDFPATYHIANVSEQENSVELTLTLTVRSYRGTDLTDCVVALYTSGVDSNLIGSFNRIKFLPTFKATTVSHRFSVPKSEYALWQHGANPTLYILMPDGDQGTRIDSIDLRREIMPAIPAK